MSTTPELVAIRTVTDDEGYRTGVTITRDVYDLVIWRADEDENGDIHEWPLMRFDTSLAGLHHAMAVFNDLGSIHDVPADLMQALSRRPVDMDECLQRDPGLGLIIGPLDPGMPVDTLADALFA